MRTRSTRQCLLFASALTLVAASFMAIPTSSAAAAEPSAPVEQEQTAPRAQFTAKSAKISGKINAPTGYSIMAIARDGDTYIANVSNKKFSLNIPASDTKGMTFHVVTSSGKYAAPVVIAYQGVKGKVSKKALKKSPKAILGWAGAKKSGDLGSILYKSADMSAYFTVGLKGTGTKVATSRGMITSSTALGLKSATTRSKPGANLRATEKDLEPGLDPDKDGLANAADIDDDGNGVLDIVQQKLFNDTLTKPTPVTSMFSLLVTPMNSAVNWHVSNGIDNTKLLAAMNEFLGIYYQVNAEQASADGLAGSIKQYEVECYGVVYCNGDASKAVTISPDCFNQGTPASERTATAVCPKAGTTSLNVPAGLSPADMCGPNVQVNFTGLNTTMDDWLFKSCDLDGDGMPNVVQSADGSFSNEVKPRPESTTDVAAGDTFTSYLSDSAGTELYSTTQVLSAVFQTSPVVSSIGGTSVLSLNGTAGQIRNIPAGEVEVQFFRPQRRTIGDEAGDWLDMGGLFYTIGISGGGTCTVTKADPADTSIEIGTRTEGSKTMTYVKDLSTDVAPESGTAIKVKVNLKGCAQESGMQITPIMLRASDQAFNQASVNFEAQFAN